MEVRISDITKPHDRIRKETVICTISRDVTSSPTGRAHGICVHGDEWLIRQTYVDYCSFMFVSTLAIRVTSELLLLPLP